MGAEKVKKIVIPYILRSCFRFFHFKYYLLWIQFKQSRFINFKNCNYLPHRCQLAKPCANDPCYNSGVCENINENTDFVCYCRQPYIGKKYRIFRVAQKISSSHYFVNFQSILLNWSYFEFECFHALILNVKCVHVFKWLCRGHKIPQQTICIITTWHYS